MNLKSPRAEDVEALALGLKLDSIFAVASRYSKLIPVVLAACLIAPAIRNREGSTAAVAVAFEMSTDICWCPAPRETPTRLVRAPGMIPKRPVPGLIRDGNRFSDEIMPRGKWRSCRRHTAAIMVNGWCRLMGPDEEYNLG